ncbi:MAG: NrtA/SsuA/CpmA family ABC transporter substrate-binding protein [Spirochaetia bacterium]|nr:NrtA/SsuA/CpmA family ABC transporter substrate-binding protein [Spirochaetia bacterium]
MKKSMCLILCAVLAVSAFASGKGEKQDLKEINISYVRSPFNLPLIIMKEKGMAEKAFGEKGIKVNYYEITSGAKQSEAIAAGSLDIASVINSASVILANAAGNPVEIFAGFSKPEKMFTIMTSNPDVKTPADLKGKKVAGPKGTVLHELLVAALKKEGLTTADIEFINMGIPNGVQAMLSGKVDCALAAAASVVNAEKNGGRVLVTCEGYVSPLLISACGKSFAEKHPDMLELYIATYKEAKEWMEANMEEALAIGAKVQDISIEDAEKLFDWSNFTDHLTAADLDALEYDVNFMLENGMIEKRIDKMDFVNKMALR